SIDRISLEHLSRKILSPESAELSHEQGLLTIEQLRETLDEERQVCSRLRGSNSALLRRLESAERGLIDAQASLELSLCERQRKEIEAAETSGALKEREKLLRKLFQCLEQRYLDVLMEKKLICELPLSEQLGSGSDAGRRWKRAFSV